MSRVKLLLSDSDSDDDDIDMKADELDVDFGRTLRMAEDDIQHRKQNTRVGMRRKENGDPFGRRKRRKLSHETSTLIAVSDLAVTRKKIDELRNWIRLRTTKQSKKSFLILSGPSGSAKLTSVLSVCKDLGISVIEWMNTAAADEEFNFSLDIDKRILNDSYG